MFRTLRARGVIILAVAIVVTAACGGSPEASDSTAGPASTTAAPAPTTTGAPTTTTEAGIASFQDSQPAIIQEVSQGTFRDPEVGYAYNSGAGSGFIISEDGLAVTNNHVVAGAATLEIFVGGDTSRSYNARILGVSECNDLALIDISESAPLPYLDWYDGDITAGLDDYAAGFPLGDPQFTLTRGIVAKARAGGDLTGTSSIDHTIEHDANVQPGNSGGPLLAEDGSVVAVNYAGGASATTTAQFYAIAHDLASPVVEQLKSGDVESIGINGWSVYDEALGVSGIWVAGVTAGSPAANADILPGDIITSLNGLPLGRDGTFKDYCDVLRTSGPNRPMNVEVLRWDTQEVFRGEINGDEPIAAAFSFAQEVQEEVETDDDGPVFYSDYETVTDDTGTIVISVPVEWSDRTTEPLDFEGTTVPQIAASSDMDAFLNGFDEPGLIFLAFDGAFETDLLLDAVSCPDDCTDDGVFDYEDPVFTGQYQLWLDCGGGSSDIVVLAAQSNDESATVMVATQIFSDADLDALDQALNTFNLTG